MGTKQISHLYCNQLEELLDKISDDEYSKPTEILSGSTIGQHVRHIIEFFQELIINKTECVCYDERKRDLQIETQIDFALKCIAEIKQQIDSINLDEAVELKVNYDAESNDFSLAKSNFRRELLFCVDHAIHHMAIIKMGLKSDFNHIVLNHNFGVAPSTLRHRKQNK